MNQNALLVQLNAVWPKTWRQMHQHLCSFEGCEKRPESMAKHYGCLSRPGDTDDDFYKVLLRVDEQMVSHLCGFFQCSCVLQEHEGIICCKKHVKEERFDTRVAYSV